MDIFIVEVGIVQFILLTTCSHVSFFKYVTPCIVAYKHPDSYIKLTLHEE